MSVCLCERVKHLGGGRLVGWLVGSGRFGGEGRKMAAKCKGLVSPIEFLIIV